MFNKNKYLKIYESFIDDRKTRKILKTDFYESHHILPKSLGGTDDDENLINLTPREHFFAHLLLAKITEGDNKIKMAHALRMMSGQTKTKKIINSKQYELAKSVVYNVLQSAGKTYQDEKILQDNILTEYSNLDKIIDRGICKCCGVRPKAINYIKNGKTFYRSKCDVCLTGKNDFKIPIWKRDGYIKKKNCETCNFVARVSEQLTVITENKKYKTICLNCQMELTVLIKRPNLIPSADF